MKSVQFIQNVVTEIMFNEEVEEVMQNRFEK